MITIGSQYCFENFFPLFYVDWRGLMRIIGPEILPGQLGLSQRPSGRPACPGTALTATSWSMTENMTVWVVYDRKIHCKRVYDTMCDFVYDTKHGYMVSGILLKIWVYDTKMYDTKCKTEKFLCWKVGLALPSKEDEYWKLVSRHNVRGIC